MLRVVECFTGGVGSEVIRLLAGHPNLALVGVLVHSEDKEELDAGELVGGTANSVRTTRNLGDILRLKSDCAIWMGKGWQPDVLSQLLRAGINVYARHRRLVPAGRSVLRPAGVCVRRGRRHPCRGWQHPGFDQ